jgi:hypothetical protein
MILEDRGLAGYIDGSKVKPAEPPRSAIPTPTIPSGSSTKPPTATLSAAKTDWIEWDKSNRKAVVQINQTVDDDVLQLTMGKKVAKDVWDAIRSRYSGASNQSVAFLMAKIWRTTMLDDKDLISQINEIRSYARKVIAMGRTMPDDLIAHAIIISLPPSYDTLSTILTSANSELELEPTINAILAEEERKKEAGGSALCARVSGGKPSVLGNKGKSQNKCTNPKCKTKVGHVIETCWAEGGGKERQGPKRKEKGGRR